MSYKPSNVANLRRDAYDYPRGSSTGKGGGVVPGTSGSQDRGSQPPGIGGGGIYGDSVVKSYGTQENTVGDDFALADGGMNDRLDPRKKSDFGRRSYSAEKPTL